MVIGCCCMAELLQTISQQRDFCHGGNTFSLYYGKDFASAGCSTTVYKAEYVSGINMHVSIKQIR